MWVNFRNVEVMYMMQHDYEYEVSVYCCTYNHEKYIKDDLIISFIIGTRGS